jgi:hypothetical protein
MIPDIRAITYCNIGKLMDGQVADTYAQGSGLIKCRGSMRLAGLYTPGFGDIVEFAVLANDQLSKFPRQLRVLSSFADPYKKTTTVQLGCVLTLLENRSEPPEDIQAIIDEERNQDIPCEDRENGFSLSIDAQTIFNKCLTELGITAEGVALSSSFSQESFDMSPGYVQVMDGLLNSESYIAYIDQDGVLQGINLVDLPSRGPALNSSNIIKLEGINSGDLPAEGIYVKYSTTKLRDGFSSRQNRAVNYEGSYYQGQGVDTYTNGAGAEVTEFFSYQGYKETYYKYDSLGRLLERYDNSSEPFGTQRTRTEFFYKNSSSIGVDSCGIGLAGSNIQDDDAPTGELSITTGPLLDLARRCGYTGAGLSYTVTGTTELRSVTYKKVGDVTYTFEQVKIPYYQTPWGSVAIDRWMRQRDEEELQDDIFAKAAELEAYGSTNKIRTETQFGLQRGPSAQEANNAQNSQDESGPEYEEEVQIAWAMGSEESKTFLEFTVPYPPDDTIRLDGSEYIVIPSNAKQVAETYGRVQNQLLLGNRNGLNIQLRYQDMPPRPFTSMYVSANELVNEYKNNGTSWAISANGIIATTDALFWGNTGVEPGATISEGDVWGGMSPGLEVAYIPETTVVFTTTPELANSVEVPIDFDPVDPDLEDLFGTILATPSDPVYQTSLDPDTRILPYIETIDLEVVGKAYALIEKFDYILELSFGDFEIGSSSYGEFDFEVVIDDPFEIVSASYGEVEATIQAPLFATYSQSSVYSANEAATLDGMQNGITAETVQTGTNSGSEYIRMDFGSSKNIASIIVGSDFDATLLGDWGKTYTENKNLQGSNDETTWTTLASTGTFSTAIKAFPLTSANYRYIQIEGTGYLAITEFYAFEV